ncbi:MAG: type VII secretion-associated protein [Corynebacterium camporealensis]|uniref:type VII secretion-associated protein n=1 Tax=Corynebacterium camporealensis TaxID=161896 RepID=UPI002A914867|nr:type VII secretion-associated protein [Corynebacterium camporealensis]MDY5840415.1 type VII secretion-associated protein [Corynebacterium camporealensis]
MTTVTITVLDAATVFEGPETVYRYDLPGTGIVEGWALEDTIQQAEKICGENWPDVDAEVIADPSVTEASIEAVTILERQLSAAGVSVTAQQPVATASAVDTETPPTTAVTPVVDAADNPPLHTAASTELSDAHEPGPAHALREPPLKQRVLRSVSWIDPFHVIIAAVILAVVGVSWWAMRNDGDTAAATDSSLAAVSEERPESSEQDPEQAPNKPAETSDIEVEGLSVTLPAGFRTSIDDGLITATGGDPNLRVLLAADPLYNVPADALFAEIKSEVDKDDELHGAEEEAGKLRYSEKPKGDESVVTWTTWVDDDEQLSVGCHTRVEPTTPQNAACRMAVDSLERVSQQGEAKEEDKD